MPSCAFLEWPEDLDPVGPRWSAVAAALAANPPDILVTNELPFGPWIAGAETFDDRIARRSVEAHERGVDALARLGIPAVISSRPVWSRERLSNEAYALEAGRIVPLHRKQFFPAEPGWYESTWFEAGKRDFSVHEIAGLRVGVLLCTELMFNERARQYGHAGAELIVAPRATGTAHTQWLTAGAMAAIVSGCYVVSSNRVGPAAGGPEFGGRGFAFAPDGALLAETSPGHPIMTVPLDAALARRQKAEYPCYVTDF